MHAYLLIIMFNYQVITIEYNDYAACEEARVFVLKDTKASAACFMKLGGPGRDT